MVKQIVIFILISGVIYFGLAAALILFGRPAEKAERPAAQTFSELYLDYGRIPPLTPFMARDKTTLNYRLYPVESDKTLILLHGSGWHSRYFMPLAESIAASGTARIYTPDLRGHGPSPVRRGDVDYIDQLVDDVADLIDLIKRDHPGTRIIIGGHSSGGGLAVRFAGSRYGSQAKAYLLMAPFLKYNAPTTRPGSGGWARPYTGRIIGLVMLNNIGLTWFNYLPVIDFNMPEEAQDGTETLVYSYRLNTAYAPKDYRKDLRTVTQPLLVLAGQADQSFNAEQYEPVITQYTDATVQLLPGISHLGLVVVPETAPIVIDWLNGLDGKI